MAKCSRRSAPLSTARCCGRSISSVDRAALAMRLVAWNCNGGFHRKSAALAALAPDVAVLAECADLDILRRKAQHFAPSGALWTGDNPQRGLAVFSFGGYRLSR